MRPGIGNLERVQSLRVRPEAQEITFTAVFPAEIHGRNSPGITTVMVTRETWNSTEWAPSAWSWPRLKWI